MEPSKFRGAIAEPTVNPCFDWCGDTIRIRTDDKIKEAWLNFIPLTWKPFPKLTSRFAQKVTGVNCQAATQNFAEATRKATAYATSTRLKEESLKGNINIKKF